MIGCTPCPLAVTENSSAAKQLLVSVTATAGISIFWHRPGSFFSRTAPSSREYSVWTRRWMNRGSLIPQF